MGIFDTFNKKTNNEFTIERPGFPDVLKTILNISLGDNPDSLSVQPGDSCDNVSKWECSEISKYITFFRDRNIYPIDNRQESGCNFGNTDGTNFIHPYGGSWFMNPFSTPGEVILKLRGYSLPNKNHQYTMFTDENNQYVNTGSISPNSNKIIELNFKIIKIIDDNTLELSPVDSNSLLFTNNKKTIIWERSKN